MKSYRCYFLSRTNAIKDVAAFQCPDDSAALLHSQALFAAQTEYAGFELWEGARCVHSQRN